MRLNHECDEGTEAAFSSGAVYINSWARCLCDFLLPGRNQQRQPEVHGENADEMLFVIPGAMDKSFRNRWLPKKMASPFGEEY